MNSIRQVPTRVKTRRTEANLGAEREQFDKQQKFNCIPLVIEFLSTADSCRTETPHCRSTLSSLCRPRFQ
ncbi:hypothetical protein JOQ06_011430, partial [Pogonophryne albipinna]